MIIITIYKVTLSNCYWPTAVLKSNSHHQQVQGLLLTICKRDFYRMPSYATNNSNSRQHTTVMRLDTDHEALRA